MNWSNFQDPYVSNNVELKQKIKQFLDIVYFPETHLFLAS